MVDFVQKEKVCYKCSYKKNLVKRVLEYKNRKWQLWLCGECVKSFDAVKSDEKALREWLSITDKLRDFERVDNKLENIDYINTGNSTISYIFKIFYTTDEDDDDSFKE